MVDDPGEEYMMHIFLESSPGRALWKALTSTNSDREGRAGITLILTRSLSSGKCTFFLTNGSSDGRASKSSSQSVGARQDLRGGGLSAENRGGGPGGLAKEEGCIVKSFGRSNENGFGNQEQ